MAQVSRRRQTTWCVFGLNQGVEHEDGFDVDLNPIGQSDNVVGGVNGCPSPRDRAL
jgi:3-mercaptopropionate dioxygenase